jgi:mercuric ion transport protein
MSDKGLVCTGAAGSAVAAICCFTATLVVLLGAVGLSAGLAWLDYVLFPALVFFPSLTGFALMRMQRDRTMEGEVR